MSDEMAKKIKDLRNANHMTLEQVANIVGVGKSTVRKWETGMIANMRRDKIALLAKALNTTPGYLMGWEEDDDDDDESKKEDDLVEIFFRLRNDEEFFSTIKALFALSPERFQAIKNLLSSFVE